MPYIRYHYHAPGGAITNCVPAPAMAAAAGVPGPNLPALSGIAGAALPGLGAHGVPGAGFAGIAAHAHRLPYTWAALSHAATHLGLYPPHAHPAFEMFWRRVSLQMACYTHGGRLRRRPLLDYVETNEAIYLSYHVGMTLAAYAAWAAGFVLPWHFRRFAQANGGVGVAYTQSMAFAVAGNNRPDIVFVDAVNGTCQIWEAKGRGTNVNVPNLLESALRQCRRVRRVLVAGALTLPNARVASVARAPYAGGRWLLGVADPSDNGSGGSMDVDKGRYYREYYRPYVQVLSDSSQTVRIGDRTYLVADLPGTAGRVGLDQRIYQILTQGGNAEEIDDLIRAGYPQDPDNADRFISPEGILTDAVEPNVPQIGDDQVLADDDDEDAGDEGFDEPAEGIGPTEQDD